MNDTVRSICEKIDADLKELSKENSNYRIGEVIKPYITKYAGEAGIDEIELFVDYMDHVALKSKKMATEEDGETVFGEAELDKPDFKLY